MTVAANAQPEKRLFVSLLTRDLSLVDAILDILDNSINAAMGKYSDRLTDSKGYYELLSDDSVIPTAEIKIEITNQEVTVTDDAGGISLEVAKTQAFAFGRPGRSAITTDRLSVYGIGLKRAIFKMGNRIEIYSNHPERGFTMDLDVSWWEEQQETPWEIPIAEAEFDAGANAGTIICVSQLYEDVSRRIDDATFINELKLRIARTYSYFLGRIVIYADKTQLTGWGSLLPIFQPKHRPFLGLVFFVSVSPEDLPWTTTKASVDQESLIWQQAKRNMAVLGREIVSFLDKRYTDEGTEVAPDELAEASGDNVSILSASVSAQKVFEIPAPKLSEDVSIQYHARVSHVNRIREYLGRRGMSAREVGKYTFEYFYKNEAS